MNVLKCVYKAVKNAGLFNIVGDRTFVTVKYRLKMGRQMNVRNPRTYTEKINWLKLYDHEPIYTKLVDKWDVVTFVEERIGSSYIIPKIGVWDSIDKIKINELPSQFVLKCTNDSGGIVICREKKNFDIEQHREVIEKSLKTNYYWHDREWPYKNVKPRILAEQYIEDGEGKGLPDYKFFCFDGQPKFMFVATGRSAGNTCFDFFDMEYNWIPVKQHYPNAPIRPEKPVGFEEMKRLATILSEGFKHVRVDFFQANGKVYFGELTFCHFGGYEKFEPDIYDYKFGEYLDLSDMIRDK